MNRTYITGILKKCGYTERSGDIDQFNGIMDYIEHCLCENVEYDYDFWEGIVHDYVFGF
jgi:hypothetical protein